MNTSLLREVSRAAVDYIAPIFAVRASARPGPARIASGTTFILDCGAGPFAVTAGHVFDVLAGQGAPTQVGKDVLVDLRDRLIARAPRLDLATYSLGVDEIGRLGVTVLTGSQSSWPPRPPEIGRGLVYAGFPAVDRSADESSRTLDFRSCSITGIADSISDRDISCRIDRDHIQTLEGLDDVPLQHDLAGISGGPMLALTTGTVMGWRLAGVVYECSRDLFELVRAVRADFIRPDGSIAEPHT